MFSKRVKLTELRTVLGNGNCIQEYKSAVLPHRKGMLSPFRCFAQVNQLVFITYSHHKGGRVEDGLLHTVEHGKLL